MLGVLAGGRLGTATKGLLDPSVSAKLWGDGLAVAGAGLGDAMKVLGGRMKSPRAPDFGKLVLFLLSFPVARQIASWDVLRLWKSRQGRSNAVSLWSARRQNSLQTHAGGTVLLKAAVKPMTRNSASTVRLLVTVMAVRTQAMIVASVIMLQSRDGLELMCAFGAVWLLRGVMCDSDCFPPAC